MAANDGAVHVNRDSLLKKRIAEGDARSDVVTLAIPGFAKLIHAGGKRDGQYFLLHKQTTETRIVRFYDRRLHFSEVKKHVIRDPSPGVPNIACTHLSPAGLDLELRLFQEFLDRIRGQHRIGIHPQHVIHLRGEQFYAIRIPRARRIVALMDVCMRADAFWRERFNHYFANARLIAQRLEAFGHYLSIGRRDDRSDFDHFTLIIQTTSK